MPDDVNRNLEAMADWIGFPDTADRRVCDACPRKAKFAVLARNTEGDIKLVFVCKSHMLDPGPLLDT